jgi:hypothetical protein
MRATRYFLPKPLRFIIAVTAAQTDAAPKQDVGFNQQRPAPRRRCRGLGRCHGLYIQCSGWRCPAGKRMANARQPVDFKTVAVTDTTLGSIDLGKEKAKIANHELRFRKSWFSQVASSRGRATKTVRPSFLSNKARSSNMPGIVRLPSSAR